MTTISHPQNDELRASLLSLAECCPLAGGNPEDCPLYLLRKMERPQRLEWFSALNEDDLVYLAAYHHVCLDIRAAFDLDTGEME